MKTVRSRTWNSVAACLAAVVCAFPARSAQAGDVTPATNADEAAVESPYAWRGAVREDHRALALALRASRANGAVPVDALARVRAQGAALLAPALDVLAQGRVPCVAAGDEPQKLSVPQRQILLGLLAQLDHAAVRAALQARLAAERNAEIELAALHAYAVVGDAKDLARVSALAPRAADDTLTSTGRDTLRAAYTGILERFPAALQSAGALVEALDPAAANELLLALGELRDPRAIDILFRVARRDPSLAQTAIAMVPRVGSSLDVNLDAEFASWLRSELHPDRTEWTRAVVRALGELDDGSSAPDLITLLSHTHKGVADASLAALRRMSRLEYPPQPALWQAWYEREAKWYDRERPRQRNALERGRVQVVLESLRAYSQHEWRRAQLAQDVCIVFSRREAPVRELACEVLGGLGARVAVPALVEMLGDPTTSVATAAWHALQRITGATLPNDREAWAAYAAAPLRPTPALSVAR